MLFAACLPSCSNEKSPLTRAEFVEESKLNFLAVFFFGCTGTCTLDPCLGKCLPLHKRNGKGAYAGAFQDYLLGENAITNRKMDLPQ